MALCPSVFLSVRPSVRLFHSCRRYRSLAGQHTAAHAGSATMSACVVSEQKTLLHCVLCRSLLRVCSLNFCFPFWVDAALLFVAKWRYSNAPGRKKTRKTCANNWSRVGARMEVVVGNYNVNNTEHITQIRLFCALSSSRSLRVCRMGFIVRLSVWAHRHRQKRLDQSR